MFISIDEQTIGGESIFLLASAGLYILLASLAGLMIRGVFKVRFNKCCTHISEIHNILLNLATSFISGTLLNNIQPVLARPNYNIFNGGISGFNLLLSRYFILNRYVFFSTFLNSLL